MLAVGNGERSGNGKRNGCGYRCGFGATVNGNSAHESAALQSKAMHFVHLIVRFYPYWALVVAFILWETGVFFKRRRQFLPMIACWFFTLLFLVGIGFYFHGRGDLYSDRWVKNWLEN